jgi:transmembrane sensor
MNPSMESSRDIEERAGAWLARRESGSWSDEDRLRFTQWLNASTENRVAFLRQEAAWEYALRLQALRGNTPPGAVPSPEGWRLSPFVSDGLTHLRPHHPGGKSVQSPVSASAGSGFSENHETLVAGTVNRKRALAAGVLVAIAAGITWYAWPIGPSYRTPIGGIASVPMNDGSKITLNTDSEVLVDLKNPAERHIELQKGEAFFEVAKDPTRPFVVSAGDKRVVAVGTKFSVRREYDDIRVFVTEGKVRIEDKSESSRPATTARPVRGKEAPAEREGEGQRTEQLLVAAGGFARAGDAGVIIQQHALRDVEDYLSWRTGYLVFRDIRLADAIAEFNRYNERKIFIQDPAVAAIRFSGKIRPTSFEAFVRLLEDGFPIRAQHADGRIILTDIRSSEGSAAAAQ